MYKMKCDTTFHGWKVVFILETCLEVWTYKWVKTQPDTPLSMANNNIKYYDCELTITTRGDRVFNINFLILTVSDCDSIFSLTNRSCVELRAKVTAIEESKDLTSLSLDELIGNLKVYETINKKDSKIVKAKGERKSHALKAKKESSDKDSLTFGSEDEEYSIVVRDFKKFFKRRGKDCPKPLKDKNQKAFIGGSWSDNGEEDDAKTKDKMCFMAQASSEVYFESSYFSDENSSIDDTILDNEYDKLCKMSLKIITKNRRLKVIRNSLENELSELKEKLSKLEKTRELILSAQSVKHLESTTKNLKRKILR
nr:hypothetical protein [Tanacetum cinerariifolium]